MRLWGICSPNPCFEVGRQTASHAFPGPCISSCSGGSEAGYVPLPAPVPCTGRPHTCAWQWDKCSWSRRDCQPHRWPAAESARAALSSTQPRHAVSQPRHSSPQPREIYGPTGRARSSFHTLQMPAEQVGVSGGQVQLVPHAPPEGHTSCRAVQRGHARWPHVACLCCMPPVTYILPHQHTVAYRVPPPAAATGHLLCRSWWLLSPRRCELLTGICSCGRPRCLCRRAAGRSESNYFARRASI